MAGPKAGCTLRFKAELVFIASPARQPRIEDRPRATVLRSPPEWSCRQITQQIAGGAQKNRHSESGPPDVASIRLFTGAVCTVSHIRSHHAPERGATPRIFASLNTCRHSQRARRKAETRHDRRASRCLSRRERE